MHRRILCISTLIFAHIKNRLAPCGRYIYKRKGGDDAFMSTINCADRTCLYQKDGKCEFNSVISAKLSTDGKCVHHTPRPAAAEDAPGRRNGNLG